MAAGLGGRDPKVSGLGGVADVGGPVLTALLPATLKGPGGHHDHLDLLVPDHLPKVFKGHRQRSLGENKGPLLPVAVHVVRIDVIRLVLILNV